MNRDGERRCNVRMPHALGIFVCGRPLGHERTRAKMAAFHQCTADSPVDGKTYRLTWAGPEVVTDE